MNVCLVHAYSRKIYLINLHLKIMYVRTVLVQKYIHFYRCTYYLRIPSDARRKELDWNLLFGPPTNLYWGQGRVRPRLGLPYRLQNLESRNLSLEYNTTLFYTNFAREISYSKHILIHFVRDISNVTGSKELIKFNPGIFFQKFDQFFLYFLMF